MEENNVEKTTVTKPEIKVKKKTFGQKVSEIFVAEDMNTVSSYIFNDVIVPAVKKAAYDTITNGLSMIFYGAPKADNKGQMDKPSYSNNTQYTRYYRDDQIRTSNSAVINRRPSADYKNFEMSSRMAYAIIDELRSIIIRDGCVSIAEYMDILQREMGEAMDYDYTYRYYGWYEMATARVVPSGNEFAIVFPAVTAINKR